MSTEALHDWKQEMHDLLIDLFPITRSITGKGVRQTLSRLAEQIPIEQHEIPSGTQVFDWTVPDEWDVREAYIEDMSGRRVVDFENNNLHLVSYSVPVDQTLTRSALERHLYSLPEQPNAIPYVTSYYKRDWGFCVTQEQRDALLDEQYRVRIDSDLKPGVLNYGELILPGESDREVLLSTYVCHPSMANNELSGPIVTTYLVRWLQSIRRRYTYRVLFVPETIGSIAYLSRHWEEMRLKTIAGFNISCIGDERGYSMIESRYGNTLADRAAREALRTRENATVYSFLERGSDERQYCSPGIDLPVVCLCRSKFGEYPEYHTSLDDATLVTPDGLLGGLRYLKDCLEIIEENRFFRVTTKCEPQLGKRNLYPGTSMRGSADHVKLYKDVLAYCDGTNDLLNLASTADATFHNVLSVVRELQAVGLVEEVAAEGATATGQGRITRPVV